MAIGYLVLVFVMGLSFTQGTHHKARTIIDGSLRSLSMDEAYLILRNEDNSSNLMLYGSTIVCEHCDLIRMAKVNADRNVTLILDTKYAYNFEIRSRSSNISSLCNIASYQLAEHGTYVIDVMQVTPTIAICSIEQTGNPGYYSTPAIVGIIFVVLYVVLTQLWHHIYHSPYRGILYQRFINDYLRTTPLAAEKDVQQQPVNAFDSNIVHGTTSINEVPSASSTVPPENSSRTIRVLPKRLRALDTFRGFSLMVMIFVNYGGGGYWFFDHSIWNGLTLADLVFPWFTWMMGVSIVLSQRSLRSKNIAKRTILWKICRRTIILFVLGLSGQDDLPSLTNLRIFGVLQRLATCYCITAILVLTFDKSDKGRHTTRSLSDQSVGQPLRTELFNSVFRFWIQWLFILVIITIWTLITFLLHIPNCPTGYVGPGGKHDHGQYQNCTGGAAGYIDRVILGNSHLYNEPTCKDIYHTKIPYDPEGILGILTGVLLCYLGVQAGHSFLHSTSVRRVCGHWLVSGIICGSIGLVLSQGGHSDSWIPINKNLWSLTFVLILASLAFIILTILYLLVDVHRWFTGTPFLWLGMNSIAIYVGHERFGASFPVQFDVGNTHAKQLAMHLYGAFFWSFVAGVMYYKKVFIAI